MPDYLTGRGPGDERDETPEVAGGEREALEAIVTRHFDAVRKESTEPPNKRPPLTEIVAHHLTQAVHEAYRLSARPAPEREGGSLVEYADADELYRYARMHVDARPEPVSEPAEGWRFPEMMTLPVSEPREDEAYAAGASHGRYDWDAKLAEVAAEMRAKGYDDATLRALTDHILGGEDIPGAEPVERCGKSIPGSVWRCMLPKGHDQHSVVAPSEPAPGAEPVAWGVRFHHEDRWDDVAFATKHEAQNFGRTWCREPNAFDVRPLYASPERAGERGGGHNFPAKKGTTP